VCHVVPIHITQYRENFFTVETQDQKPCTFNSLLRIAIEGPSPEDYPLSKVWARKEIED